VDSQNRLNVVWYGLATGYPSNTVWYAIYDGSWLSPEALQTGTYPTWMLPRWQPVVDLAATFTLRQLTNDLKATFSVGQGSGDLKAEVFVRSRDSADLYARFKVEPHKNLKAIFSVGQQSADLKAEFRVGESLDVYTIVGTTGTHEIDKNDGEVTVAEMTKTLTCVAGDKLVVSFDSTITSSGDSNNKGMLYWLEINGVEIGKRNHIIENVTGTIRWVIPLTRAYEIPSTDDYTIRVRAQVISNGLTPVYRFQDDYRTLTVQHFG